MKKLALTLLLAGLIPSVQAADAPPPKYIHVTGEGEVKVEPDEVNINFQIETFGPELKAVQNESAIRTTNVMETLKKLGVAFKDIQTSYAQISPRYDFTNGKRKFREYYAVKSFNAKIRDISGYGAVMNGLMEAKVENIGGVQFSSSKLKVLKDDARKLAAADAKAKAETLAGALGVKVGKPMTISEETIGGPIVHMQRGYAKAAMGMAAQDSMPEDSVAAGELTIRTTVNVQFELQ